MLGSDERLAQLFNVMVTNAEPAKLAALAGFHPGGITLPPWLDRDKVARIIAAFRGGASVPPIVSADLEGGAIALPFVTQLPNQLGMAAIGDASLYAKAVAVLASEGAEMGVQWAFAPVLDINAEFRSAIVGTRSFGSDEDVIADMGVVNIRVFQSHGLAATAKHWPGEGFDARDQHLVTTINPLSLAEWHSRCGRLFRAAISAEVLTIMSAHVAFPAYAEARGVTGLERFRPASASRLLNEDLLRGELGFNGLIVSDATTMGGLASWADRSTALPDVLAGGCDMILFSADIAADLNILRAAIGDGRLTWARVDEAVLRTLALKAVVERSAGGGADCVMHTQPAERLAVAEAVANRVPTLVKDVSYQIPLNPETHPRILLIEERHRAGFGETPTTPIILAKLLGAEGFTVTEYVVGETFAGADTIVIALAQESLLTKSHIYLDWAALIGPFEEAMRRPWPAIPTILVSFGQPYYLYDAPRVPCVINAYTSIEAVQRAVIRQMVGKAPFVGVSPVDAFCGLEDARY